MKASTILQASNVQELKLLGSYSAVKNCLEQELGIKLGTTGWKSFLERVTAIKKVVSSNKDYLASLGDENSFRESKNKASKLLEIKVKARGWNELRNKIKNIILLFSSNVLNPYDYYEKTKLSKFKNSSKLEGINIKIPDQAASLERVLAKHRR